MTDRTGYEVRALGRGIAVIGLLNRRNGLTATEIARELGLPRPTVFRILRTVEADGYVVRSASDNRFRLTPRVRDLSNGYRQGRQAIEALWPLAAALCRETVWPISVTGMYGDRIVTELSTDRLSPMIADMASPGHTVGWLLSAAGHVWLSFLPAERAAPLRARALVDEAALLRAQGLDAAWLDRSLAATRAGGYAYVPLSYTAAAAVPIFSRGLLVRTLSVRYGDSRHGERGGQTADQLAGHVTLLRQAAEAMGAALAALPEDEHAGELE